MTKDERKALLIVAGGMELLRNAIMHGDPQRQLELRARDVLTEIRGVLDGKAKTVGKFAGHR
jgi:hypothetical protein